MNKFTSFTLLSLIMGWSLGAAASEQVTLTAAQQSALGIRLGQAETVSSFNSLMLPGEIILPVGKEHIVSAPQDGMVDKLYAAIGQDVQRGQVLAHLSSQTLLALQRDYLQAQTRQRLAKKNLDRDTELFQDGIIAERRFLLTQGEFEDADAALQQSRQSLRIAGLDDATITRLRQASQLGSGSTLTAPIAGQVIEQNVHTGQRVDMATPLFRIADLSTLWVLIHVPVNQLTNIRHGTAISLGSAGIQGKVIAIVRNASRTDQTVQVRAEFRNTGQQFVPGQFVEAQLSLEPVDGSGQALHYRLPRTAITRHEGKTYIFSSVDKLHFEVHPVDIVAEQGDQVTVKSSTALKSGIALSGIATLKAVWTGHSGEEK
ncbi:RND family efflux transporter, MFP subunit [Methylobacillus rhizosphaerae]|uniref:RND family efflux transporter, MFP subunit n=1 Tax=Methylobacillus rhizosphaerae TaxID=551994 RepID=A0A238ZMZ2_9PROT|nr:efflux RND transporter periplasmic adaptor subunit [Methylobacillus rhizosphaerae]SNR84700.1 RND family efflux transporter, MFP subunit [Methylobacillus rhizosphaerae]